MLVEIIIMVQGVTILLLGLSLWMTCRIQRKIIHILDIFSKGFK